MLVQGRASFSPTPDRAWLESITPDWDRFLVPRSGGALGRVLDVYYWQRVAIDIEVVRVVAYPDGAAHQVRLPVAALEAPLQPRLRQHREGDARSEEGRARRLALPRSKRPELGDDLLADDPNLLSQIR